MSVSIWYFDPGSESCDECQGMGGCYEDEPDRPHDHCDCVIEEHTLDEGCQVEYRNAFAARSQEDRLGVSASFENCGEPERTYTIDIQIGIDDDMGGEIREVAEDKLGWSPPDAITETNVNLPANTHGGIQVELVAYVYHAFAEKWAVCFVGGQHFEHKLDDISGSYTCVEAAEVDLDSEACF
jgi:hypothetical protein